MKKSEYYTARVCKSEAIQVCSGEFPGITIIISNGSPFAFEYDFELKGDFLQPPEPKCTCKPKKVTIEKHAKKCDFYESDYADYEEEQIMPIHIWGDKDFDWEALDGAIDTIYWWTCHIGRFGGQLKEKFGGLRFYAFFSDGTLYSLCKPGYYYCHWPKWWWRFDLAVISRFTRYSGLLWLIRRWQHFIYNLAYQRAIKKYPHIREEILMDADYLELIKGTEDIQAMWTKLQESR